MILKSLSERLTLSKNKELVALSVNSEACVAGEELCVMKYLRKSVAERMFCLNLQQALALVIY